MQTKELNKEQLKEVIITFIIGHVEKCRNMFDIWPYLENANEIKLDDINPAEEEKKLLESIGLKSVDYDYLKEKYESYSYDDLKKEFDRIEKIVNESALAIKNQARINLTKIKEKDDSELTLDEIFMKYDKERTSEVPTDEIDYSKMPFEKMLIEANKINAKGTQNDRNDRDNNIER